MTTELFDDDIITVCDKCFTASCWHGEFMCDDNKHAGTDERSVSQLRAMGLEHPSHWLRQKEMQE